MLSSLRSRLALSNLLITLLGLAVITVVFSQLLAQRNTDIKKHDRAQDAQQVAQQIELLYRQGAKPSDLQQMISIAHNVLGAEILVISPKGTPKLDSNSRLPQATGTWRLLNKQAFARAQSYQQALKRNPHLIVFQAPIRGTGGRNGGAVLLVAQVTDVRTSLGSLSGLMAIAVATALLVWIVIGLYFTSSISRPLLRIIRATERMAHGDYRVRVPVNGHGEIGRLATSFNSMAQQVQNSNQVLKDFVGNVSHDLRTPLTMITGFSEALLDGTARPHEVEEAAQVIHDESLKMQRMVNDLLQLTRLESGLLKLQRHPTALRLLVQSTIDRALRMRTDRPSALIHNEVPASLPRVDIDGEYVERVVRNLLENALQYTPASGTITVGAVQGGEGVVVSVADTGRGIAPDDLARIFERFYRSDKSRERVHGHSGLGLAIVREIVEAHGGKVEVRSQVGIGTTFSFSLPLAPQRDTAQDRDQQVVREVVTS